MHTCACVQGYWKPYRVQYSKLFDEKELIETVFSSIKHIYIFQQDFLKELEAMVNPERIEDSQIWEVLAMSVSLQGWDVTDS